MSDRLLPGTHSRLPSASFLKGSPRPGSPSARVTDCSARSTRFPKSARPAVRATADDGDREGCDCERRTQADPEAVVGEDLAPFMAAVSRTLILQGCMTWCSAESKVLCGVAAGPWERRRDGAAEQNEGPDPHRSVCLPAGIHGRERPHRGRGVRKHTRAHATTGASKGGVAPVPGRVARPATSGRVADRQDAAVQRLPPQRECAFPEGRGAH